MEVIKNISGIFFIFCLAVALYFCYLIFKPFLIVIFVSAAIVVTFYPFYEKVVKNFNGRESLASIVTCLLIIMIIIIPVVIFLFYLSKNSIEAYNSLVVLFNNGFAEKINVWISSHLSFAKGFDVNQYLGEWIAKMNTVLVSSITKFLKGTSQLFTSILLMFLTMFFLFKDGKQLLIRIMKITPLYDKYDKDIFDKFREVSYSAIVSTVVTGIAQGIIAGIAFAIVGMPFVFLGIATIFASLIPFVGAALVWVPVSIVLLIQGKFVLGIFLLLWGAIVVSLTDNLLRPILMKGKTNIHPLILFFSIFGGIAIFGFWGIIFGPLIIAIALTLLHIYEMEYNCILFGQCAIKDHEEE